MSELLLLRLVTLKTPFIMPEEFCFGCNTQIPGRHSVPGGGEVAFRRGPGPARNGRIMPQ